MQVRFYAVGREIAGLNEHRSSASDVAGLRADLEQTYGSRMAALFDASSLLFKGERLSTDSAMRFDDHDVVDLLPPFAGG